MGIVSRNVSGLSQWLNDLRKMDKYLSAKAVQSPLNLAKYNAFRSTPVSSTHGDLCRCDIQVAKYACPSCNVAYCSLTCFRSEANPSVVASPSTFHRVSRNIINAQKGFTVAKFSRISRLLQC